VPVRIPNSTADIILKKGSEVYSVTRGRGDGGKPNPFVESKLKTQATTRNWNLLKEIAEASLLDPEQRNIFSKQFEVQFR